MANRRVYLHSCVLLKTAMNPYECLGLHRNASAAQIKQAYKKRVFECHPDRGGNQDEFLRVSQAWAILSDPAKKADWEQGRFRDGASSRQDDIHRPSYRDTPSAYDLRYERYRATGEGENPPIYGPHSYIVMGILFVATLSGGILLSIVRHRRLRLSQERDRQHEVAELYEAKALQNARKVSDLPSADT
ncbi:hypothetical protein HDV03_002739 [Kappamyces sp. JEL0829]|nr:hypothetical protein HDV03_002739 [Kappamyces sp. JEL0829]